MRRECFLGYWFAALMYSVCITLRIPLNLLHMCDMVLLGYVEFGPNVMPCAPPATSGRMPHAPAPVIEHALFEILEVFTVAAV